MENQLICRPCPSAHNRRVREREWRQMSEEFVEQAEIDCSQQWPEVAQAYLVYCRSTGHVLSGPPTVEVCRVVEATRTLTPEDLIVIWPVLAVSHGAGKREERLPWQ